MTNYSSDLSSFMPEHELVELLWDNGQIVMQGQSNRTKKSSIGTEFSFNGRLEEKFGHNVTIDSVAHNLPPTVPSTLNSHENDVAPWLNYAIDDSIQHDLCSELFSELTCVHTPSLSNANSNLYQGNKSTGFSQTIKDSSRSKFNNLTENAKPKDMDLGGSSGDGNNYSDLNSTRFQKPLLQSNNAVLMNFPYFSRHASIVKASLQNIDCLKSLEKSCTVVNRKEVEKGSEAVVASSSVCSDYDAVVTSNDPKQLVSKKRDREGEESGEESDDLEEELFAVKKPASVGRVTTGKRSRAAEVHNLSERRRRDRINEKMKALQELIPNCNKVDKASMLDEAIEYLKSLQLQVQMMSMGNGLFMHPMMLPAGLNYQHLRAPNFSPFGVGMGMGMGFGYGMGMIDVNGSPSLVRVPQLVPGTQFSCPNVAGVAGFHGMPQFSSISPLGIPGHRFPASVPHAPLFNSQAGLSPQNSLKVSDKVNLEAIGNANIEEPKGQASKAVCQLMQKESKRLDGRRDKTTTQNIVS